MPFLIRPVLVFPRIIRSARQPIPATLLLTVVVGFFPSVASALKCPPAPEQVSNNVIVETKGKAAALGKLGTVELKNKTEIEVTDLFNKVPNADRVLVVAMLTNLFCQVIDQSNELSNKDKLDRFSVFTEQMTRLMNPESKPRPTEKSKDNNSRSKSPGKKSSDVSIDKPKASDKNESGESKKAVKKPDESQISQQPTPTLPQPKSTDDHVSQIEALLTDVSDPAYRKLVAAVIHAFNPKAEIAVGALVATPDGTRKIDVEVRSSGKSRLTGIDVVDLPVGQKAGIEVVDAAQSKQADIKADAMIVCSNTGFDDRAIKKAKRMKIGLISVLRRGDQRVKAVIEEVMYLRRVDLNPISINYTGDTEKPPNITTGDLKYQGESVDVWLLFRAIQFVVFNPTADRPLVDTLSLKNPTEFDLGDKRVKLRSFSIRFHPHVKWFSQTVQLDATTGIYDYLNGKVLLPGGEGKNSYVVQGINFETAIPLSSPPEMSDFRGGLIPGEVAMQFLIFENVPLIGSVKNPNPRRSAIDALVRPEDLSLHLKNTEG